jgi:hypothetical protein
MKQAATAGNRTPASALLAAIATAAPRPAPPAGTASDSIQLSTWEWEGGQYAGPLRPGTRLAVAAGR